MSAREKPTTVPVPEQPKKAVIPPPGRKLSSKEARALAHKQFGNALARLAK